MNRDLVLDALGAPSAAAGELPLVAVAGRPATVSASWSDQACDVAARRGSALVVVDDDAGRSVGPRPGAASARPWPVVAVTTSARSARRADFGLLVGTTGPADHDGLDEAGAVALAARFLDRCSDGPPAPARPGPSLVDIVPFPLDGRYDARDVLAAVLDDGTWVEFDRAGAAEVLTAVARIGGRSVGIAASLPASGDGVLTPAGAARIARLVRWCEGADRGGRPLVTFVDTDGIAPAEDGDDVRAVLDAAIAVRGSAVAKVAVVVGRCVGLGATLTAAVGGRADLVLPWPRARFARESSARTVGNGLHDAGRPLGANAVEVARDADVFDVVHPDETRARLVEALDLLRGTREYAR
jgi:propionyl-CoA carboxylase beta chain